MIKIENIFIHCSDTDDDLNVTAKNIYDYHVNTLGWDDIGYHHLIERSGEISTGRPESIIGAGILGHNDKSIHICLIGRKEFTELQITKLLNLVMNIKSRYGLMISDVKGHYEINHHKSCPNINMDFIRGALRAIESRLL